MVSKRTLRGVGVGVAAAIVLLNVRYHAVPRHAFNDEASTLPRWNLKADADELATVLRTPPSWQHRPTPPDVLAYGQGDVSNATLKRLLKVAHAPSTLRISKSARLDAKRRGAEVSPLLFGGFIEHMGRVIDGNHGNDGGIWAELLADRKFFHAVEQESNPSPSSKAQPSSSSSSTLTKSPWRAASAGDAQVTSPRLPPRALVRGGRVMAFRFPCPSSSSSLALEPTSSSGGKMLPEQQQQLPPQASSMNALIAKSSASLKEKLAGVEEDDAVDGSSRSSGTRTKSRSGASHGYGWVGEIEQSGLPLEKGRAYRGYVWATSGMLSRDDSTTGQNGTSSSPAHFGAAGTSSETNDGVALVLEVWLRHPNLSTQKDVLLARVTDSAILAGTHRSSTNAASGSSKEEGDEEAGSHEGPTNVYGEGYRGARVMAKGGAWRRFDFGFVAPHTVELDCACGVTNRADCAGDCRSGDGQGGFNANDLNGARGGIGEDAGGHCGNCGAALAIIAKRIDLTRSDGKWKPTCSKSGSGFHTSGISTGSIGVNTGIGGTGTSLLVSEEEDQAPAVLVGAASLIPADAVGGMFRAETVHALQVLRPTLLRWPGGNFASGYMWRDGVGPRDSRPPRKNPAWAGVVSNDFGVHEFMHLCALVGAEPLIVVNAGLGTALDAAALVAYVNLPVGLHANDEDESKGHQATSSLSSTSSRRTTDGSNRGSSSNTDASSSSSSSSMWRARLERALVEEPRRRWRNGEQLPWQCQWWGIGNEMYGPWQLGTVPFAAFVQRHARFSTAMRRVSPEVRLVGVGAMHLSAHERKAVPVPGPAKAGSSNSHGPRKTQPVGVSIEGGDFGFASSWTGQMMASLSSTSQSHNGQRHRVWTPLQAISEHFYIDTEKSTAALHAKQASWRVTRFAQAYRGLHKELAKFLSVEAAKRLGDLQPVAPRHSSSSPPPPGICLDEFGYWYGPWEFGQLGMRSSLKDALGVAVANHALMRNGDVYTMATYSQAVNVFGAVKTSKLGAVMDPVGQVLALYSSRFGRLLGTASSSRDEWGSSTASPAASASGGASSLLHQPADASSDSSSTDGSLLSNDAQFDSMVPNEGYAEEASKKEAGPLGPAALAVRGSISANAHGPKLRRIGLEVEGVPFGYAAGDPGRLIDGIAASGYLDHGLVVLPGHASTSALPLHSGRRRRSQFGPRVVVALVNLHDSAAVTVNFQDDMTEALLQAVADHRQRIRERLNQGRSSSQVYSNATADAAAEAQDAAWWAQRSKASGVVAQCWAVHDACLLDQSQDATTSPSCPDHTALNQPAKASPPATSAAAPPVSDSSSSSTQASAAADSNSATTNAPLPSSSQPSMGVVISALPPEWTKADRIRRVSAATAPRQSLHGSSAGSAVGGAASTSQSAQANSGEETAAERKARKRARRRKRQRGEPVEPPRATSTSAPGESSFPNLDASGSARKSGRVENSDGSIFAFHGAMTLLPLSATVCDFEFGSP